MIRKGQKLCNYILDQGYSREEVHVKLFHMQDYEFDRVVGMDVDYEVPENEEGDEIAKKRAELIKEMMFKDEKDDTV